MKKKAKFGICFVFCKIWVENPISVLYKEQRVVIKLVYMINAFWPVFPDSYCLCSKKTIYIEFRVFWKGKEKGKLEVQKDEGGLLPILGPRSRQINSILTKFL